MSQYDTTFDLKINVDHCDQYFMVKHNCRTEGNTRLDLFQSSTARDFALYLEGYLLYDHHTLGLWVSMTQYLTSKYL